MDLRYIADRVRYLGMDTQAIRQNYLLEGLFQPDTISLSYIDLDRAVIGGAMPASKPLRLNSPQELRADFFTQRREIGVMNIGDAGSINVDSTEYQMANRDALYIGRGAKDIEFRSKSASSPAKFYLISYLAHTDYPTALSRYEDAEPIHLGSIAESNKRTIFKHIHAAGIKSCQLVMGFTELDEGSVWNTMPAHKHMRRSEIYMYFNLGNAVAFHFMGPPEETRHIVVRDSEAVISPGWSIHAGSGTKNYTFIWAMGGENQDYTDMDPVALRDLR